MVHVKIEEVSKMDKPIEEVSTLLKEVVDEEASIKFQSVLLKSTFFLFVSTVNEKTEKGHSLLLCESPHGAIRKFTLKRINSKFIQIKKQFSKRVIAFNRQLLNQLSFSGVL